MSSQFLLLSLELNPEFQLILLYYKTSSANNLKEVNAMRNYRPDIDDLIFAEEETRVSDR